MLRHKTILITGGGSGIGEALALQLANDNTIIICGRNETKLKTVSAKNKNITYELTDVSDYRSIENLFARLREKSIVPDVLINNAGVVEIWELHKQTLSPQEIFEKANTNFAGAVAIIQLFISQAVQDKTNIIISNTSEIARMPIPVMPLYSASKAALHVFTKSLRIQLKNTSFKVIELLPPAVDTDMPKKLNNTGKLISPAVFAAQAIRKINEGKTEITSGPNTFLFKFFQRVAPETGLKLIDKMSRKQLGIN